MPPSTAEDLTHLASLEASVEPRLADADLVVAARSGHRWASQALFDRHADMVGGLSYRLLGADTELDDVVQEAFLQALKNLHRLREPQAFASWLCSITVRTVRRTIAHRRMLERLGLRRWLELNDDIDVSPTANPYVVAELRSLYRSLDRVSVDARLVLLLRRVEGYTVGEVAALMSISPSTVKRRLVEAERVLERYQAGSGHTASPPHRSSGRSAPRMVPGTHGGGDQ